MGEKQTGRQMDKEQSRNQSSRLKPATAIIIAAIIAAAATIAGVLIQNYSHWPDEGNNSREADRERDKSIELLLPPGLVIFNANEWYEEVISDKKEIVCKPQTELNVGLRKVGVGMPDATVERCLTYLKPKNDALEIEYEFTSGREIGVHFLVRGFRQYPTNFIRLDEYEGGCLLLRVTPVAIDDGTNTDDYPAVTFGLKLRQGDIWFSDNAKHSSSNAKLYEQSGWCDIRIPIKPYLDQMRMVSSTVSEPLRLEQLLIVFGDQYSSPLRGRFWLNAIVLVKKEKSRTEVESSGVPNM